MTVGELRDSLRGLDDDVKVMIETIECEDDFGPRWRRPTVIQPAQSIIRTFVKPKGQAAYTRTAGWGLEQTPSWPALIISVYED